MASLDQCASYSIAFQGGVDPRLIDMVGPLKTETTTNADGCEITILSEFIADQAAVVGLIRTLHSMGIVFISIQRVADHVSDR